MTEPAGTATGTLSFGPFTVTPHERLVMRDGVALPLGAKAFDTLIALMSRPNEVVSKWDLMARVWPDVTVEEGSLRFHIASAAQGAGRRQGRRALHHHARPAAAIASWRRSRRSSDRGRAAPAQRGGLAARQPAQPAATDGRARRRVLTLSRHGSSLALRHDRRRGRRRQDHRCGRDRASTCSRHSPAPRSSSILAR